MIVAAIVGLLVCTVAPATGQATDRSEVAPTDPTPQPSLPTMVLLAVDGPDAAERAEAISAHVHAVVEIVASDARPAEDEPRAWYELAVAEAQRRSAVAVMWVEARGDDHYVLSVVRPDKREIRWRRIDIDPSAPSAAIEALGVVTLATTTALLADSPLQMERTPIPAPTPASAPRRPEPPAPPPARARRERGRALLAVGYIGTSYARELPWQSGVAFEGGWAWPFGLHATVGYALYQRARAQSSSGRVDVTRHPITALFGYHRRFRALGYGGDAGVILDAAQRRASSSTPGITAGRDRARLTTAITVRARASVLVVWRLEVFTALGLEVWLSQVRYGVQDPEGDLHVVLNPRRVRATVSAGLAVRL